MKASRQPLRWRPGTTSSVGFPRHRITTTLGKGYPSSVISRTIASASESQEDIDWHAVFKGLSQDLGIVKYTEWYKVTRDDIRSKKNGQALLKRFRTLRKALMHFHPEYQWDASSFTASAKAPKKFWSSVIHQRDALQRVGTSLGITKMSDWYDVSTTTLGNQGLTWIWKYPSMEDALKAIFPEYPWDHHKFIQSGTVPRHYWRKPEHQRELLDTIALLLGVNQWTDWYKIRRTEVVKNGGRVLFNHNSTLAEALQKAYPEHPWQLSEFADLGKAFKGYWKDNQENIMLALNKAEKRLGINAPEDWYTVSLADLKEVGFPTYVVRKAELAELLARKYPSYKWERLYLLRGRFAQQHRLEKAVSSLFPDISVINARKEAKLLNPTTGLYLELDIYLPPLNLAFEYQDKHHYTPSEMVYVPLEEIQQRDKQKEAMAMERNITLITVPCWWDGRRESLIATIKQRRPDLLTELSMPTNIEPISEEPPPRFFEGHVPHVEDIGEPTTACFFTLSNIDPTGWWVFEKYDGVRGFWNPLKKTFFTRRGVKLNFPQHIIDKMPNVFLDGELWFGLQNFSEAMKVVNRRQSYEVDWSKFKYMVFDLPKHTGTYSERYTELVENVKKSSCEFVEVVEKHVCEGSAHLERIFQDIVDKGGEGVILRDPDAPLQPGRSQGYLKHKKFRDAEARIVEKVSTHLWECELPNGVRFTAPAGTTEFYKRWDPQPGDIVSFKHHGYLLETKKPKIPTLYRVRPDLTWEDIVHNWKEQKFKPSAWPIVRKGPKKKQAGYWSDIRNRRQAFIEYAQENGFDPSDAEKWKTVSRQQILDSKGIGPLGSKSLAEALKEVFPETTIDMPPGPQPRNHWQNVNNLRAFFDEYAKEKGIDPTNPNAWYRIDLDDLYNKKGGSTIRKLYIHFKCAIQEAYPEITFDRWKDKTFKQSLWKKIEKCREAFDSYAALKGFDPLDANNWYNVSFKDLQREIKGSITMAEKNGGYKNALRKAYPELVFDKWP